MLLMSGWKNFSTARKVEKNLAIVLLFLDIKGPGIRTGDLEKPVTYEKGEKFKIVVDQKLVDNPKTMFVDYSHLLKDIYVGAIIRLDSGVFSIKVVEKIKIILLVKLWINLQLFLKDILIYLDWKLNFLVLQRKIKKIFYLV